MEPVLNRAAASDEGPSGAGPYAAAPCPSGGVPRPAREPFAASPELGGASWARKRWLQRVPSGGHVGPTAIQLVVF